MEPETPLDFTIIDDGSIGDIKPVRRKQKHKEKPRSYFSLLLSEIEDRRSYKYRYEILLIPLRHFLTYFLLLTILFFFLFLLGFVIIRVVLPDSYDEPLSVVTCTFWGYIVFSGVLLMFVLGSWIRLMGSILCCDRPSL